DVRWHVLGPAAQLPRYRLQHRAGAVRLLLRPAPSVGVTSLCSAESQATNHQFSPKAAGTAPESCDGQPPLRARKSLHQERILASLRRGGLALRRFGRRRRDGTGFTECSSRGDGVGASWFPVILSRSTAPVKRAVIDTRGPGSRRTPTAGTAR